MSIGKKFTNGRGIDVNSFYFIFAYDWVKLHKNSILNTKTDRNIPEDKRGGKDVYDEDDDE